MQVIEGHKGCYEYSTHFTGLEGHGSAPELGVNAVEYAVRYVGRLLDLREVPEVPRPCRQPVRRRPGPPSTPARSPAATRITSSPARRASTGRCGRSSRRRRVRQGRLARYCAITLLAAMRAVSSEADIVTETIGEVDGLVP
jgi:acetylornithine deacetylase